MRSALNPTVNTILPVCGERLTKNSRSTIALGGVQLGGGVLYSGNPDYDYYTCMGLSYLSLRKQEWFARYCSEWIMYDNDDDEDLPFADEDVLAKERKRNPLFAI